MADTTVTWTNPHPFIRILGHCTAEYGYAHQDGPRGWQSIGVPEILPVDQIYEFTGRYHHFGRADRRRAPVLYIAGKSALLEGLYQLLSEKDYEIYLSSKASRNGNPGPIQLNAVQAQEFADFLTKVGRDRGNPEDWLDGLDALRANIACCYRCGADNTPPTLASARVTGRRNHSH